MVVFLVVVVFLVGDFLVVVLAVAVVAVVEEEEEALVGVELLALVVDFEAVNEDKKNYDNFDLALISIFSLLVKGLVYLDRSHLKVHAYFVNSIMAHLKNNRLAGTGFTTQWALNPVIPRTLYG